MSLKSLIRNNPVYQHYILPLRQKYNAYIESKLDDEAYFTRRHKKIFGYTPDFKNPQTQTYLEESPFNRSQKITEPKKGLYRLETDLVDSILLDGWIKMWEQEAQIVRVEKFKL